MPAILSGFPFPLEWNLNCLPELNTLSAHGPFRDHTILTLACFPFLRPSYFCFRNLYLFSPLPARISPRSLGLTSLTLLKFLATWNLFGETFVTTLSEIISTSLLCLFHGLASLARFTWYRVYCPFAPDCSLQCSVVIEHGRIMLCLIYHSCQSAQAAVTNHHRLGNLSNRILFSHSFGCLKSKIKVPTHSASGEGSFIRLINGLLLSMSSQGLILAWGCAHRSRRAREL